MRGFDHATILSSSFHGLCKERLAQWPAFCDPNSTKNSGGGGVLPEKLGGGVLHASRLTLTLFPRKTCDFPYPISDLIKTFDTLFQIWSPGSPARDRSAWQDVTTRTQLACVASVSERFRSKERGTRTTTWNLPGPSGTWDCIAIVYLAHPSPSSVEANT